MNPEHLEVVHKTIENMINWGIFQKTRDKEGFEYTENFKSFMDAWTEVHFLESKPRRQKKNGGKRIQTIKKRMD